MKYGMETHSNTIQIALFDIDLKARILIVLPYTEESIEK